MQSINPANNKLIKEYKALSDSEAALILNEMQNSFSQFKRTSFKERSTLVLALRDVLLGNKKEHASLITMEMGKVLKESVAEIEKCVQLCEFYAKNAEGFLRDEMVDGVGSKSFVTYNPLGIVLGVMPWNFPFWQVLRAAIPAIMAGNVFALKHASNVSGCALAIEGLFKKAGFKENIFKTLLISSNQVARIIENNNVRAVTITGSVEAGKQVAKKAGECLKKCVLELGGSDAYIVLEDADLELAAKICAKSRLINAGQTCISAKRFVVARNVHDDFVKLLVDEMKKYHVGDGFDVNSSMGPMSSKKLMLELDLQVRESVERGAKCLLGGEIIKSDGNFYPPTILTDVVGGMPAYDEELFGPVAAVIKANDEADVIRIANDSVFGLGGAVFTRDEKKGEEIARNEIEAGCVVVNDFVKSDPRLPFGGIKESGHGRELSYFGIREFCNVKSVIIG